MKYRVIDSNVDEMGNIYLQVRRWYGWTTIKWWYYESWSDYYKMLKKANKLKIELDK